MISIPFIGAWIIMVALGVVGHELNEPRLFVSYWLVLAACILIMVPFHLIRYALGRD